MDIAKRALTMLLTAGAVAVISDRADAQSLGTPSRVCQCMGCGWGAGYHAPLVRTPGVHPQRVPRNVPIPAGCGPLYPAAYEPLGCYSEACYQGRVGIPTPALMPAPASFPQVPTVQPAPAPTLAPVNDRHAWRFTAP
jgi:hypothetical protein